MRREQRSVSQEKEILLLAGRYGKYPGPVPRFERVSEPIGVSRRLSLRFVK